MPQLMKVSSLKPSVMVIQAQYSLQHMQAPYLGVSLICYKDNLQSLRNSKNCIHGGPSSTRRNYPNVLDKVTSISQHNTLSFLVCTFKDNPLVFFHSSLNADNSAREEKGPDLASYIAAGNENTDRTDLGESRKQNYEGDISIRHANLPLAASTDHHAADKNEQHLILSSKAKMHARRTPKTQSLSKMDRPGKFSQCLRCPSAQSGK